MWTLYYVKYIDDEKFNLKTKEVIQMEDLNRLRGRVEGMDMLVTHMARTVSWMALPAGAYILYQGIVLFMTVPMMHEVKLHHESAWIFTILGSILILLTGATLIGTRKG